jgi:hypothetical protein
VHHDARVGVDGKCIRLHGDAKASATKSHPDGQHLPRGRHVRIDAKSIRMRSNAAEAHDERLPKPTHRGQMKSFGGRSGQVVEVDAARNAQCGERVVEIIDARKEGGVNRR